MLLRQFIPSDDEIRAVLSQAPKHEDDQYATDFRKLQSDEHGTKWSLLAQVFGFHFKADNAAEPFSPMVVMDGKRSMVPTDLTNEQLDELNSTLETITEPEFQARIADVIWLCRRDPHAARIAVEAYLLSGSKLEDPNHWTQSMERYERALRLARQIEPKGELPKKALTHLEMRVKHYDGADPLYFTLKALELLEEFAFGDFIELATVAGRIAQRSCTEGDFRKAREHYDVQARLLKRGKKTNDAETARVNLAECFVKEAEAQESQGSFMASRIFWEHAIKAFRDRPSLRYRILDIQKRISIAGEKTLEEMKRHSVELDLSEQAASAKSAIAGLRRDDALFAFAFLIPLMDPKVLRDEATEMIREHPLQAMIDATMFDAAGRKVGVRPSAFTDDPTQLEAATIGFMEQNARFYRGPNVIGCLAPAMQQLLSEHEIDETVIENLVGDSPFIPNDRRSFFVQAFVAGFRWDFCTALHLLIPQVENALRQLLSQEGVTPINIDANGVEEVWSFERILSHECTSKVLGENMTYEMRSLLTERLGSNLRNLLAHGLLQREALNGEIAFYLWWVLLRLTALPCLKFKDYLERRREEQANKM